MLQYFRYNNVSVNEENEFNGLTGWKKNNLLLKKIFFFLFMVYSVFFLAVATPYVDPNHFTVYVIGFLICLGIFIRLINFIFYFFKYKEVSINLTKDGISIVRNTKKEFFSKEIIKFIEYDLLSNLKINIDGIYHYFPVFLLEKEDHKQLLKIFEDVAPNRTMLLKKIWEVGDALVMALILAVHIIQYVIQNYYIPSGSMMDTLKKGDHLFAEKITYGPEIPQMLFMDEPVKLHFLGIRDIERGDIIIFQPPPPADENKDYIKRCIAVEGDKFHIENGKVYINDIEQKEPYVKGITDYALFPDKTKIEGIVPKGFIIALGDNRENSQDSRFFGYLDKKRIKSRAFILYWNLDEIKNFNFSRFGLIR